MSTGARDDARQVLADCAHCLVEGAVLELVDPRGPVGVAAESRCRLCGRTEELGREVIPGRALVDPAEARAALEAWAREEGETDVAAFVHSSFSDATVDAVIERLCHGEPVATSFDSIAWLFPGVGHAVGGSTTSVSDVRPSRPDGPVYSPDFSGAAAPAAADRRDPAAIATRALVAVMLGDGEIHPVEREFVERYLSEHGFPALRDEDLHPWRPYDLGHPADSDALIEAMATLAYADAQRDGSEWRIVREFARCWGYPVPKLEALGQTLDRQYSQPLRRLWLDLRSIFVR